MHQQLGNDTLHDFYNTSNWIEYKGEQNDDAYQLFNSVILSAASWYRHCSSNRPCQFKHQLHHPYHASAKSRNTGRRQRKNNNFIPAYRPERTSPGRSGFSPSCSTQIGPSASCDIRSIFAVHSNRSSSGQSSP